MVTPALQPLFNIVDDSIPAPLVRENGGRPSWLRNGYSDNRWVITDTGDKPNRTIHFDVRLPNGKSLVDYPNLLDSIKRVVYGVRTGPLLSIESGSVHAGLASNLLVLARWMISNQIERFDDLTLEDVREYTELAAFGVHNILNTEGVLNHYVESLAGEAGFDVNDSMEQRQIKAAAVFPLRGRPGSRRLWLSREEILASAGLDGIGGTNRMVVSMLDDIEALCGLYQAPSIRRRMAAAPSPDEFDGKLVTEEQLRRLLMPFEYLHVHRRYLSDAIHFHPFPLGSARSVARQLGKAVGRTGTVPVQQAATLIERAIRWVLDYAPPILDLKDWADACYEEDPSKVDTLLAVEISRRVWPSHGVSSPFPIIAGRLKPSAYESGDEMLQAVAHRNGMPLPVAVNFLATACATVIAAFSARRVAEILGLKAGCIEPDKSGQPWMRVFIHKTDQAESIVPIPEVVVKAVLVLERLSQRARRLTNTPYLMQFNRPGSNDCVGLSEAEGRPVFRLGHHLRRFGYFVDVPALDDGSRWTFRPHQFRRFFAILYIWIYELGDLGALSYHLRHSDSEMTRRYVSDDELGHIIAVADRERTAAILASAALGKIQMSGTEGTRLKMTAKRLYDRMSQRVQAVSERKFAQRILRLVERSGLTLHALPWGYCGSADSNLAGSCVCSEGSGTKPDFGRATVSTCGNCAFNVRTSSAVPYLNSSIEFHRRVELASDTPEIIRRASSTLRHDLKAYMTSVLTPDGARGAAS